MAKASKQDIKEFLEYSKSVLTNKDTDKAIKCIKMYLDSAI